MQIMAILLQYVYSYAMSDKEITKRCMTFENICTIFVW